MANLWKKADIKGTVIKEYNRVCEFIFDEYCMTSAERGIFYKSESYRTEITRLNNLDPFTLVNLLRKPEVISVLANDAVYAACYDERIYLKDREICLGKAIELVGESADKSLEERALEGKIVIGPSEEESDDMSDFEEFLEDNISA